MQPVYGTPHQLQVADDVLVEDADVGERLHQVEDDGRLELVDRLPDRRQVVVNADHEQLVPALAQRGDDVPFHPPLGIDVGERHVFLGHESFVDENEDAILLHSRFFIGPFSSRRLHGPHHRATRCRPLCR